MSPKIVNKEKKKRKILNAAIKLFAKKGYNLTTVDEIAEAAGIGKGTIYEYFQSKIDFVKEIYKLYITPSEKIQKLIEQNSIPPIEKIKILLSELLTAFNKNKNINRIIMQLYLEGGNTMKEAGIDLAKLYKDTRMVGENLLKAAAAKGEIRKDIPEFASMILLGMFEGVSLQLLSNSKKVDIKRISESIIDIVLNGIKTK